MCAAKRRGFIDCQLSIINCQLKGRKMFGTIKKIFFTGMFGVLYVSFVAQLIYVLGWSASAGEMFVGLGFLAVEWLVLISARYLSKKSASGARDGGYNNHYRR
jgi:hypothetical protein